MPMETPVGGDSRVVEVVDDAVRNPKKSPDCLDWILRNDSIASHNGKPFFYRLSNKNPIKWVAVYGRKSLNAFKMGNVNGNAPKSCQFALPIKIGQNQFRIKLAK